MSGLWAGIGIISNGLCGNGGEWVDEEILIDWNNERAQGLVGSIGE